MDEPKTKLRTKASSSTKVKKPVSRPLQKRNYVSAYKRAEQNYERIQAERRSQAEARREEKERREAAKSTRKGQPRLNAQIEVLVEKIQRKENPAMKRSTAKK
uniref:rRNA-processing protein FYV7 n=1 Tax=Ditylenchus dipsaci TaxID=166011 RepID=A0A915ECC1_9BILA